MNKIKTTLGLKGGEFVAAVGALKEERSGNDKVLLFGGHKIKLAGIYFKEGDQYKIGIGGGNSALFEGSGGLPLGANPEDYRFVFQGGMYILTRKVEEEPKMELWVEHRGLAMPPGIYRVVEEGGLNVVQRKSEPAKIIEEKKREVCVKCPVTLCQLCCDEMRAESGLSWTDCYMPSDVVLQEQKKFHDQHHLQRFTKCETCKEHKGPYTWFEMQDQWLQWLYQTLHGKKGQARDPRHLKPCSKCPLERCWKCAPKITNTLQFIQEQHDLRCEMRPDTCGNCLE